MSKPNKPPQITSFALTASGEDSAALALRLLGELETKQRHFTIPKGSGELLCWSSDNMTYKSIPYVEKDDQKVHRVPNGAQLQLHIFEEGDWCEQIHLCHEVFCRPKLSSNIWNSPNSNIKKLHIEWQEISISLASFLRSQSLIEISIHWCTIPKNSPKILFNSPQIMKLECFGCDFIELSPMLNNSLIELTLSACSLKDQQILNFPILTKLKKLSLYENPISDNSLSYLSSHQNIEVLDLRFTKVVGWNFAHISKFDKLKILHLHGSQVQNTIFSFLAYLPHLRQIDLRETEITRSGIDSFHRQRGSLHLPQIEIICDV